MNPEFRVIGLLLPLALGACGQSPHPIDQQLSGLRPVTVAPLKGMDWPAGTLLCPMTLYQSELYATAPVAERVNAFLKRKKFVGEEGRWTLIVVEPDTVGDDGIEHLFFKRGNYDVISSAEVLRKTAETVPAAFAPDECVPAERARVLATRSRGIARTLISFGTE